MPTLANYIYDLTTGGFDARKIAATRLGESKDARALGPLLGALKDESWSIQASAISGLGHLYLDVPQLQIEKAQIIAAILPFLTTSEPGLMINTIRTLGWLKAQEAVDAISTCLDHADSDVRGEAVKTLGSLGNRSVVPHFTALVSDTGRDKWERVWAVTALGNLGDPQAVDSLIAALSDERPKIRQTAIDSLVQLGDRRATGQIRVLLKDENDDVRFQAIKAAVAFSDTEALTTLRLMAREDSGWGDGQPLTKHAKSAVKVLSRL